MVVTYINSKHGTNNIFHPKQSTTSQIGGDYGWEINKAKLRDIMRFIITQFNWPPRYAVFTIINEYLIMLYRRKYENEYTTGFGWEENGYVINLLKQLEVIEQMNRLKSTEQIHQGKMGIFNDCSFKSM